MFGESPAIEHLQSYGISDEVVARFRASDIKTCLPLIYLSNKAITEITGVSDEAEVKKISRAALRLLNANGTLGERLGDPIPDDQGIGGEVLNKEEIFSVVVKNLPGDTSREQVRDHFKAAGYAKRIGVVDDFKKKNRSAYLYYASKSSADIALTFDKSRIGDQEITVEYHWGARSDESSSSGQSG
ncbi:hypothetical protein CTI12_AA342580 [Artemisia annua]|uniref:RRM domain-containing protein n=1 Tax=Artemisia annua TaxID=35608 RepID=A0A2U1MTE4_ARTAN|nr:hypothetical protein CTI12_AA342580 [Artemisia annua]